MGEYLGEDDIIRLEATTTVRLNQEKTLSRQSRVRNGTPQ